MTLKVPSSAAPVGIQHRLNAGSKFDGTVPATAVTLENGINKYAAGTAGGLFYFENTRPVSVLHYAFDFGTSVPYEIAIVSLDGAGAKLAGERLLLESGTARTVSGPARVNLVLGCRQALEVTVSSGTAAMIGSVWGVDATAHLVG